MEVSMGVDEAKHDLMTGGGGGNGNGGGNGKEVIGNVVVVVVGVSFRKVGCCCG